MIRDPCLRRRFGGEGADGGRLRIRHANLYGKHLVPEGNDAIGRLGMWMLSHRPLPDRLLASRSLGACELILPHNPLVTVHLAFDPVLKDVAGLGEQSDDLEPALGRSELVPLMPVGRKADRLSHSEFVDRQCHLLRKPPLWDASTFGGWRCRLLDALR